MKAQATVEWMIILSVSILILAVMLSFNGDNFSFFQNNLKVSQAKATLNDLKRATDFVYSQGEGARTRLMVTVPSTSNISMKTLDGGSGQILAVVFVNGKQEEFDVYTDANLTGGLPAVSGSYCMDVLYSLGQVNISRSTGSC
jgi:hypothetical protein